VEILAGKIWAGKLLPMQSTDFYQQILGISIPWKIVKVDLDMEAKRVVIRAKADWETKWYHPDPQLPASLHKWTERTWRHLDTGQFESLIIADVTSVKHKDGSIGEIAADSACVVTVGSVGHPRHETDRRAAWVLWDPAENMVEFRRVDYSCLQAAQEIVKAGLPLESAYRLLTGEEVALLDLTQMR
jgi:hypothetical protein